MALEEQVVKKLIEKNFHISFAESCTGGMCCGTKETSSTFDAFATFTIVPQHIPPVQDSAKEI